MMAMFMSGGLAALAIVSARIDLGAGYVAWYAFWSWAFWRLGRM